MKKVVCFFYLFCFILFYGEDIRINYPAQYNYYQTYNDCALFAVKAVIVVLEQREETLEKIRAGITQRLKNNYTLPWGIETYLKKRGITAAPIFCAHMGQAGKLEILRTALREGKPVILLIGLGKGQHYITLLGCTKHGFYVYDSLYQKNHADSRYTLDTNGAAPGNRTISEETLISLWDKGGVWGLYRNYGIVCSK